MTFWSQDDSLFDVMEELYPRVSENHKGIILPTMFRALSHSAPR